MCEPTTIAAAMFAMQAGSAAMQHKAAGEQAHAQNAARTQNTLNAQQAMRDDYTTTGIRMQQEQQASTEEAVQRAAQARSQMATASVAADEAGISGLSVENVLRNISGTASRDIGTINQNREWSQEQMQRTQLGVRSNAQNRINSMQKGVKPSGMALAFNIGAGAANSASSYKQMNAMP